MADELSKAAYSGEEGEILWEEIQDSQLTDFGSVQIFDI